MAHSPAFARIRRLLAVAGWARARGVPLNRAEEAFELDRRALLRGAAAGAALAVSPLAEAGCGTRDRRAPSEVSVAVVGAGIAGLHCAWRLHEAGFQVTVYEAQDRVGGRMWSGRDLFPEGLVCEIGGELIDSNHATMWALAEEFGLQLDDRFAGDQGIATETFYVNGARVTGEVLLEQTHAVAGTLQAQFEAAESSLRGFTELNEQSLADWLDQYVPASEHPELHAVLQACWVGEYGLETSRQSALNLIYLFSWDDPDEFLMLGESDERWHTHGGNDQFPAALATALGDDRIRRGAVLESASGRRNGPYTLTFRGGETAVADHLVFAVPFSKLRDVDLDGLDLSAGKRRAIDELQYGTNAKVMGGFSRRPWREDHAEAGLVISDLPMQSGWDTTIGQETASGAGVWTNFLGGDRGVASGEGTPEAWFAGVLPDLETLWPGSAAAHTGTAVRMHWPSFEWTRGSYSCYGPGQWEFWSTEGAREGRVHFCGEHCSLEFSGWMEGAAETGGFVAAEIADDHGGRRSASHDRALGAKLLVPHGSYHGDVHARIGLPARRRLVRAVTGRFRY